MVKFTPANSAPGARPAFVEAHPELSEAHRLAQKAMFGAAREAKLSYSRDLQIRGMNEALGLKGDDRLTSRRELTIAEMKGITAAIEAGLFCDDWTWAQEFTIAVTRRVVITEEVSFEPSASRYERMAANSVPTWMKGQVNRA